MHSLEHRTKISEARKGKGCGTRNGRWTPKVHKKCDQCGEHMETTPYRLSRGLGKYCSKECARSARVGQPSKKRKGETRTCPVCESSFYATPGQLKKGYGIFCSISCSKLGHKPWNKGKTWPEMAGENNPAWKGGTATAAELFKGSAEYKLWRTSVYKRDEFTCQSCGRKSIKGELRIELHAHHILPFAQFPHKRTDISNGITLCKECHWKLHGIKEKQS